MALWIQQLQVASLRMQATTEIIIMNGRSARFSLRLQRTLSPLYPEHSQEMARQQHAGLESSWQQLMLVKDRFHVT
jgi:hypothetical protein